MRRVRCAIYTRKSSEEGLEQEFNSLDAQREACEAFIASQKHEGWELLPDLYDDGGISGGHLDRPALQRLMAAVDARLVDQIVVYKIDRLTRSLADFAKLVERLDSAEASFVSVTQSFNTATSMGRLTLNVLLSFAQFEREVTAERIRDKIAASKRKGLWMGGTVPMGYRADGRSLKIDPEGAATIQRLYALYIEHGSLKATKEAAAAEGLKTMRRGRAGGAALERSHIYHILTNPVYAGRIRHKRNVYPGQHPALIAPEVFEQVKEQLSTEASNSRGRARKTEASPLRGKLFDETGDGFTPSHSCKNGQRLRYYISGRLVSAPRGAHPEAWRLPADELEALLADLVLRHLSRPDAAHKVLQQPTAARVLAVKEQLRRIRSMESLLALIARADLSPGEVSLRLCPEALAQSLALDPAQVSGDFLSTSAPFTQRRRGVELKLHLGAAPPEIDMTLVRNIVTARRWLARILNGDSFAEIAAEEGTSKRRVQDLVDLALLAPDLLDAIAEGTQPASLTTDRLIKTGLPSEWSKQRAKFAAS